MYVKPRTTNYSTGYIVEKPGCKAVQFCSPEMSIEEKLRLATEFANNIEPGDDFGSDFRRRNDIGVVLPNYISYLKRGDGFRVKKPGYPVKEYRAKSETRERKLERAIEHLKTLV